MLRNVRLLRLTYRGTDTLSLWSKMPQSADDDQKVDRFSYLGRSYSKVQLTSNVSRSNKTLQRDQHRNSHSIDQLIILEYRINAMADMQKPPQIHTKCLFYRSGRTGIDLKTCTHIVESTTHRLPRLRQSVQNQVSNRFNGFMTKEAQNLHRRGSRDLPG